MDLNQLKDVLKETKIEGKNLKIAAIAAAALLVVTLSIYFIAGYFATEKRMERASGSVQRFIEATLNPLKSDPRFAEVIFAPSGESLVYVQGSTKERKDCEDLRTAVTATQPPMPVKYMLTYNDGRGIFEAVDGDNK
jgi:hypothetical protein